MGFGLILYTPIYTFQKEVTGIPLYESPGFEKANTPLKDRRVGNIALEIVINSLPQFMREQV